MNLKLQHGKCYYIFYIFMQFTVSIIFKILFRVEVVKNSSNKIPIKGRLILCSNHISYIDPVILSMFFPRYIYYIAKKELFKNKFLSFIITFLNAFPVNRLSVDKSTIRTSVDILEAEQTLGIFPEGTRSVDGIIREGQKGAGLISILGKSPILPLAITGTNKIIQKPHKRIFFPKVKIYYGNLIHIEDIVKKYSKKEAINIILEKVMISIKELYNEIK